MPTFCHINLDSNIHFSFFVLWFKGFTAVLDIRAFISYIAGLIEKNFVYSHWDNYGYIFVCT